MGFRLKHVALTVRDRQVSAIFYRTYFGMSRYLHEDDHLLILSNAENDLLALSVGQPPEPPPRTTHFGFQMENVEAVLAMREKFSEGCVKEAEFQDKGPTRVQVFDPDGYRVEVFAF